MPVQKRSDEVGVLGGFVDQVVVKPCREPVEILVAFGQDSGLRTRSVSTQ
jgi:hypothetical protein